VKDERNVEICLGISTDKASSPINIYGMSKAMTERLFCEAESVKYDLKTKFITARYGNVLMTTGSVVPKWKRAYESDEEIKVTDPKMTRFFFTLDDSIDLIFYALAHGLGGDIISTKMPHVILGDLANIMSGGRVPVRTVGVRPGEKRHECLIADFECKDAIDIGGRFVIRPHSGIGQMSEKGVKESFTSDKSKKLSDLETRDLLRKVGAFGKNNLSQE
ncbi:MAG: polysaccharide biosynthesis protein, partial [Nanoarchaeota archaeon]|nr:polysaccharide biosynthesis protein [Nanoarchaeota archaeon]